MQKQLNINDINQQFVDSISFCLISYSGCLGPSGYMFFMDDKGNIYSCNYDNSKSSEYVNPNELCKKYKEHGLDLDLKRICALKGWESFYLGGCGNYLYVCPKKALNFYRLADGRSYLDLFNNWQDYARNILCT